MLSLYSNILETREELLKSLYFDLMQAGLSTKSNNINLIFVSRGYCYNLLQKCQDPI